jgi:hypothetical protein
MERWFNAPYEETINPNSFSVLHGNLFHASCSPFLLCKSVFGRRFQGGRCDAGLSPAHLALYETLPVQGWLSR